ncbi:MAG: cardiolipin synthase [Actinomycetia bacterium]|nr:cardiolipin synthase [Actinomycetes bacterium]
MTAATTDSAAAEADPDPINQVRRTLEGVLGVAATEGNRIDVLLNGDRIFPAMLDAIDHAEHTIDFLTFVYWDGEIGTRFARALAGRANAGVRVRVLLDGWGAHPMDRALIRDMERAGVVVRWFRPLSRLQLGRMNHRTHRKLLVIDEAVGFTGGVGIADEWKGDARNEHEWRDTHFRIDGPAVDGLRAAFLADWAETHLDLFEPGVDRFPEQPQAGDAVVQCVRSAAGPGQSDVALLFRSILQLAEQRLRITTAYFVPDDDLTTRLCDAADRGVEVEILLPGPHADKRFVQLAAESSYATLLRHGVRVASYQPSMLHAKVITVDGLFATIGSANFNARSVTLDDEINLVVIDPGVVSQLDGQFENDLERSVMLDPTRWAERSFLQRVRETIVSPMRPVE